MYNSKITTSLDFGSIGCFIKIYYYWFSVGSKIKSGNLIHTNKSNYPNKTVRITLIGAGNVAWHLAFALENVGNGIYEVYSRDTNNAKDLAMRMYDAKVNKSLNFADSLSSLFILAIADDALDEVLEQLVLPEGAVLVHTSGSKPLAVLNDWARVYSDVSIQTGVFYPLQTFSKQTKVDIEHVPICIEASNHETEEMLVELGQQLSKTVYLVDSNERRTLHVAAVFACNFPNYLWTLTKELLDDAFLEMDLLKPLIRETVRKALLASHPGKVQTGPARRGDTAMIQQHIDFLKNNPEAKAIYRLLSEGILNRYDQDRDRRTV